MPSSNELIYDALVRQQVNLQRLSHGEANKMLRTLSAADKELSGLIAKRLTKIDVPDFTTQRWQAMVKEVDRLRSSVIKPLGKGIDKSMMNAASFTVKDTVSLLDAAVPVEVNFATPPIATVRELARSAPFGGADMVQTLGEWMTQLADADRGRILGSVRQGLLNGEDISQIQRRVMKATKMTRNNAEAITRTSVNHASNTGRQEVFSENQDVIQGLRAVATLDGRTSPICRARDGQHDAVEIGGDMKNVPKPHISGSPRRPPFHLRCRTIMIAILDGDSIADLERPFVADKRTRAVREKAFRAQAKERIGKERWKEMTRRQRNAEIQAERWDWTKEKVGTVPAKTTYDEWLRNQSPEFQDEVLGQTKAQAFRNGATMDQYIDRDGNVLSIDELRSKIPEKMPPRKPSISGPGTPSATQIKVESRRRLKIEKNKVATEARKARQATKKAARAKRLQKAAERKAKKEAASATKSERARRVAEKKKLVAQAEAGKAEAAAKAAEESAKQPISPDDMQNLNRQRLDKLDEQLKPKEKGFYSTAEKMERTKAKRRLYSTLAPPTENPAAYRAWVDSLSDEEFDAFNAWSREYNPKKIRDWQRGRPLDVQDTLFGKEQANLLEGAISRAPQYQGTMYRGSTMSTKGIDGLRVGDVIKENALASATYDPTEAVGFAVSRAGEYGKIPVIFKMENVRSGAVSIQNLTSPALTHEAEILMSSRMEFEIVSKRLVQVRPSPFYGTESAWEVILRAR